MFILKNLVNPVNDCLAALASQKVYYSQQFFVFLHRPSNCHGLPQHLHASVLASSNSAILLSIV